MRPSAFRYASFDRVYGRFPEGPNCSVLIRSGLWQGAREVSDVLDERCQAADVTCRGDAGGPAGVRNDRRIDASRRSRPVGRGCTRVDVRDADTVVARARLQFITVPTTSAGRYAPGRNARRIAHGIQQFIESLLITPLVLETQDRYGRRDDGVESFVSYTDARTRCSPGGSPRNRSW